MMSLSPRPPTMNNSIVNYQEFAAIIDQKSANFIGRDFVFTAIHNFLNRYNRGYFTIIGLPGSGKSAIIAQYIKENSSENRQVIYYNAELEGKNQAEEFLKYICFQIIATFDQISLPNLPDNATEGSWFLSLLLQQISDHLQSNQPNQKLIIAIDSLNCINSHLQPPGTNIFYLPRYIPQGVYFLLTRRRFLSDNSGLLIEAPVQSLHLEDYPQENKQDIQAYIQSYINLSPECRDVPWNVSTPNNPSTLKSWLNTQQINAAEFITNLTNRSENNFMYVSQILAAINNINNNINNGFYDQYSQLETSLPPELETYYQQHLQQMLDLTDKDFAVAVLKILAQQTQPISVTDIANLLETDEFDVEEILESWFEFLQVETISGTISNVTVYRFYHDHFRQWLISSFCNHPF
ncbi:ATP-binding protein [Dolichospermum planctonicum CS-1226]|uniref:ATP-binding protein n=1 Tax=Dolichospermum planctonicum CS-1226 TaxID=3021751 RepID=A0ABT5AGN6_9CYAN|nr:ATP-binding protein [Dolichospermum planctonicum]MDB9536102.1 ATP-binding protein [Dolichospermum planctonicum CS-1226]